VRWSLVRRKLAWVDRAIDKAIANAEIPGAVVMARVPWKDEVVEHVSVRGMAVLRPERIPMARTTIFDLASLTKPIATTTAVLQLVHEGEIALDDPVSRVLPVFSERDKDDVTLRHLLTHSSGLKPWRAYHELLLEKERKTGEQIIATSEARESIIDRTLRSGLVHEPGEAAVYGDLDFIALGAVVEAIAQQPLDEYCAERIFRPIGMPETFFVRNTRAGSPLSDPERRKIAATENCPWRNRILWGEVHDPNASAMGGVAGHAGLFAPAEDMMKFARTLLDVYHGRSDLLPRKLLETFFTRQKLPENSDWALGWDTPAK
jgi:CubicO group peptidase (beta-lactamase class C family)